MVTGKIHIFDFMFKSIIKDASSPAVVHLINGIYKEFVEVDMTLKKLVEVDVYKAVEKAEKRGVSRTAKAMKAGGEAISKIMRYTGLSRREIMAL